MTATEGHRSAVVDNKLPLLKHPDIPVLWGHRNQLDNQNVSRFNFCWSLFIGLKSESRITDWMGTCSSHKCSAELRPPVVAPSVWGAIPWVAATFSWRRLLQELVSIAEKFLKSLETEGNNFKINGLKKIKKGSRKN